MTISKLDDLFLAELQETYAAEKSLAAMLSRLDMPAGDASTGQLARTRQRIQSLEQMFGCLGREPESGKRAPLQALLAEIEELPGGDDAASVDVAAVLSAMETARHYLLSRYATLALWANELCLPEVAKLAAAILQEEKAGPAPRLARPQDSSKGISLGERLTAMFDRKR